MQPIIVRVSSGIDYPIHFSALEELPGLLRGVGLSAKQCLILTDSNVAALYLPRLITVLDREGYLHKSHILPPGEQTKSLHHLSNVFDWALNEKGGFIVDRSTILIALGGGVIGDLGGFAAATILRGIPLVQIPTTLLAQVDSSVGGKTGINHPAGKNLIGAFYPPRLVLTDTGLLRSLDDRDYRSGLAELLKAGLIADRDLVDQLDQNREAILTREKDVLLPAISRAVQIKANVVTHDEKESGLRTILNFGHTLGHALEALTNYELFTHGEAVAFGMKAAFYASQIEDTGRAIELIQACIPYGPLPEFSNEEILSVISRDKKRAYDAIRLVLLKRIGEATLPVSVDEQRILDAWRFAENQ